MLNSLPKPAVLLTGPFTRKSMRKNGASRFLLGTVLVLLMLGMPQGAHAQYVRYTYSLWEEGDPAFVRKGTYDLFYFPKLTTPKYGFPWVAATNIDGYCNSSGVTEYGGKTLGWMVGYTTDYSFISAYDPYANAAWSVAYNKAYGDGSFGTDFDCRSASNYPFDVYGYHVFFLRAPQYQTRFTGGLVVGDLLLCGTSVLVNNCNWYYIYQ